MPRIHPILAILATLTLGLALLAGCGDDDGASPPADDTTRATIGATGGQLSRTGEATLTVPAGALPGDVDFTMDENGSPAPMTPDRTRVSPALTVGPHGTQFGVPATLTLHYDEGDLGGADEDGIVICTNDGTGWTPLATTVDEGANTATAFIDHLSDYCATIPFGEPAEGVYAILELTRVVNYLGVVTNADMITARFDTVVDPCNVHHALHPDSLFCDEYELLWDPMLEGYLDDATGPEFLVPGEEYVFTVHGNDEVPDLTESIVFPPVAPYVTNIDAQEVLPLDGFTVEWTGTDAGTVYLGLVTEGSGEAVDFETDNDGSHTFTAADLAGFDPGTYALNLIYNDHHLIDAEGYDTNSVVNAGSVNVTLVSLADEGAIGPDGGVVALGGDGALTIPAGALSTDVTFTAAIVDGGPAAPDGWQFMTPTWSIEPSGTTFATDATLRFDYDEGDLNGNHESTIAIFTHDGSAWTQLTGDVYEILDQVEAGVAHLSAFAACVEVTPVAEGVYCEIEVRRSVLSFFEQIVREDDVAVRFDAVVDPEPVTPLDAAQVVFGTWTLAWDSTDERYEYFTTPEDLLSLGGSYDCVVSGDADVPSMVHSVTFIDAEPHITAPVNGTTVPNTGFDVTWGGTNDGQVRLVVTNTNAVEIIDTMTDNDGLYSVSAAELAGSPDGILLVDIYYETEGLIDEAGFDPASTWKAYSISLVSLFLGDPVE